jgi:5'-3' exonuclease
VQTDWFVAITDKFKLQKAPGEAEAELACLNKCGTIDAVLTEDGDAFVFGATHVIRRYALVFVSRRLALIF